MALILTMKGALDYFPIAFEFRWRTSKRIANVKGAADDIAW
jgi:hypothetical protein